MQAAIQCKYSCRKCGIHHQVVTVRQRGDENVVEWFERTVAPALSADHDQRSPLCIITELSEVMVPTPEGTDRIGTLPPPSQVRST
jgi:hypothetical protein